MSSRGRTGLSRWRLPDFFRDLVLALVRDIAHVVVRDIAPMLLIMFLLYEVLMRRPEKFAYALTEFFTRIDDALADIVRFLNRLYG